VGLLVFDGMTALDLVGPAEAFASVMVEGAGKDMRRGYEVSTIGVTGRTVVAESGVMFKPQATLRTAPPLDTIIVPGGSGLRNPAISDPIAAWIRAVAGRTRRIASVCTGLYGLAASGLMDGRRVTTHWRFATDIATKFPRLRVDANALFLKDGQFYSSAGVVAGIDLALYLIEEDFGGKVALSVARELVVYLKRSGGQEQYSEPLRFQMRSSDPLSDLVAWVSGHLDRDLSVTALAQRACMGARQLNRRFKAAFGTTPGTFVRTRRLDESRRRLTMPNNSVDTVARSVGFQSADSFRRAFEARFGIAPSAYRSRFSTGKRGSR
jgi:transcriptional regulator GlxA family with amidase domain